ncbi:MAG: CoB--CoM heterodisulfide reductase iron-sulfur subunit A family protein, partial [Candidatus Thorarchaeota archaeon]|nr:CoB--CoM heterodisulfide reductase iron-sulfur subunit A family protein [Candidatus Thorarchaeota archaeon]
VKACERNAIDMDMEEEIVELHVGAIIVATGFQLFDVSQYPRLGYGHFANVIHAMEFERLINAAGPTHGHLVRLSDGKKPKSIGFVQCVGARDVQKGVPFCSRVCCMYSIKNATMALEHYPDAEVWVYYADIRAFGKGFEEFYEMAKQRFGVKFIRGRVAEVMEGKKTGNLVIKVEDTESTEVRLIEHDLLVISPGVIPPEGMDTLAKKIGIEQNEEGYIEISDSFSGPIVTKTPGVFVCGCADGPKDIPDSVSAGSAAAMKATIILSNGGA